MNRRRTPHALWVTLAAIAVVPACGGDASGPPPSAAIDCSGDPSLILETITTFDLGSDGWYSYNDHTPGSTADPSDAIYPVPVTELPQGDRCDSMYAVHLRASGLADWGGGLGTQFPDRPKDASAFDGIAFWAKKGPDSFSALRLGVYDVYSSREGGYCDPKAPDRDPNRCDDSFGSFVNLSLSWRFYAIEFAEMRQGGWGKHAPTFAVDKLYGLNFAYQAGNWDVWIDDVSFFKKKRLASP
jgi:hypothetical protein